MKIVEIIALPLNDSRAKIINLIKTKNETAGVGIITKQNTTKDVKPGETWRQAKKLKLVK
ncbi:uncharacterized protein METZ01_LOCUS145264 [marine metagenome]|jgi:hypothetical protein|uniref:Uncharacterized protein n=1 Tax=marine metagenome TaxID=408172 RepID=A0A381ZT53_9ZZZZ|tara:strand:- start:5617 stop:5796 length:180 start_codon:yes stop_codon:yes gene_type:complete